MCGLPDSTKWFICPAACDVRIMTPVPVENAGTLQISGGFNCSRLYARQWSSVHVASDTRARLLCSPKSTQMFANGVADFPDYARGRQFNRWHTWAGLCALLAIQVFLSVHLSNTFVSSQLKFQSIASP